MYEQSAPIAEVLLLGQGKDRPFSPAAAADSDDGSDRDNNVTPAAASLRDKLELKFMRTATGFGALERPIDELLTQAAFAVCGSDTFPVWSEMTAKKDNNLDRALVGVVTLSHASFLDTLVALRGGHGVGAVEEGSLASLPDSVLGAITAVEDEAMQKAHAAALVRARFQLAAALAQPHIDALRAAGFGTVRSLCTCELDDWGLPIALVDELRRLLGKVLASAAAVDATKVRLDANGAAGRLAPGEAALQREPFDARFQRSAYDLRGRPLRRQGEAAGADDVVPADSRPRLRPLHAHVRAQAQDEEAATRRWSRTAPGISLGSVHGGSTASSRQSSRQRSAESASSGMGKLPALPPPIFDTTPASAPAPPAGAVAKLTHPVALLDPSLPQADMDAQDVNPDRVAR